MKKSIFLVAVIAAFAFTSCKENAAEKVSEENVSAAADRDAKAGKYPAMTFEESVFDFGTIEQGTPRRAQVLSLQTLEKHILLL